MFGYNWDYGYESTQQDFWDMDWLTDQYENEVVKKIMAQGWFLDELEAGVDLQVLLDEIWKDFPKWAPDAYLKAVASAEGSLYAE